MARKDAAEGGATSQDEPTSQDEATSQDVPSVARRAHVARPTRCEVARKHQAHPRPSRHLFDGPVGRFCFRADPSSMSSPIASSRSIAANTRARLRCRRAFRFSALLIASLLLGISQKADSSPVTTTTTPASPTADAASTSSLGQPRLRRLHLVRPDLIRYPLAVEAIC